VDRHGRNEVTLNRTYRELAEHYGTAVIPARVRAPKDKAMVEGTVGVISTFILAAIRNEQFLSLSELNTAIMERLETFNHKPFQKRDGSRASAFEEEKPFLLPLPPRPFELATWKVATVGPNYHISVENMNYSTPYEYIKQKVDVRITKGTVEIFFDGNRICSHPRLYGRANQYSTVEDHMPPNHQQYVQWNGERFAKWAAKIGCNTETVVRAILAGYKVEQQGYKACMGILKLADKYSAERLENACKRALSYTPRPSLKNVQTMIPLRVIWLLWGQGRCSFNTCLAITHIRQDDMRLDRDSRAYVRSVSTNFTHCLGLSIVMVTSDLQDRTRIRIKKNSRGNQSLGVLLEPICLDCYAL
jgi:hypothetical protein